MLRCDNGEEFIVKALQQYIKENNVKARLLNTEVHHKMESIKIQQSSEMNDSKVN